MQYLDQADKKLRDALLENIGTLICFRVGPDSARYIAPQFDPVFTKEDFMCLGSFQICLRLVIDGHPSRPLSGRTVMTKGLAPKNS